MIPTWFRMPCLFQMMTGLYRDSEDAVRYTCREFIALKPDTVRIYPTVILKHTRLGRPRETGDSDRSWMTGSLTQRRGS